MKDLTDVRAEQATPGFWLNDRLGDRLTISLGGDDELFMDAHADYLVFTREQAEQLVEALRRLLTCEKIKP